MKRRFFTHFEITRTCMQAGVRSDNEALNSAEPGQPDVFDNLAEKMRTSPDVLQMLNMIGADSVDKIVIGVGREYAE